MMSARRDGDSERTSDDALDQVALACLPTSSTTVSSDDATPRTTSKL
jgi:hypothetical protein